MALVELILGQEKAQIGLVRMDASIEEVHRKSNVVTEHPVEDGANIVDHIRRLPDEITIDGVVTQTPVVIGATLFAENPIEFQNRTTERVGRAYDELERIMNEGELIDVITTFKEYSNMALLDLSVVRNARNGNVMRATMRLREVRTAVSEQLTVPTPEDPANQPVRDAGKAPTAPPPPPPAETAADSSVIYDGLGLNKLPTATVP